ncbi:MAG: hypothetical protein E7658_03765 [Ruminococcaceae bacterium]|nr:hypothetical protein [Oscillospiraceae bacterium]
MEKIITMENLHNFAYCNHKICKKPIKGLVVSFFGFGTCDMYDDSYRDGQRYGEQGILFLVPYQNPWAWMNRQNVEFTEELFDLLFRELDLPADLPIVSSGCSMGGMSALVYMIEAKRKPIACLANCPVCDLTVIYNELPETRRAIYSAVFHYDCTLEEAILSLSPIHLIDKLPKDAAYCIYQCEQDRTVLKNKHSDRLIEKMGDDFKMDYVVVPDRDHCDMALETWDEYHEWAIRAVLEA